MAYKCLFVLLCFPNFLLQLHYSSAQNAVKAAYWLADSGLLASDIDSTLFTHLFCAFAQLDSQVNQLLIPQENIAAFSQFTTTVQRKNPSIKTLLSIGGGNVSSETFAAMASQPESRRTFVDSSIQLARSNGFLGLDLDWEHQTMASEMTYLSQLLQDFRAAVDAESRGPNVPKLILTAALAYSPQTNGVNYPAQNISNSLDWINVMAYDFYAPTRSDVTRPHAALYDPTGQASASFGITAWIQAGVSANKLVLGFPYYGYAWRLANPNNHGLLAPALGIDDSVSSVDGSDGSIGYKQIEDFIAQSRATVVYNATFVTNYCYTGTTWIGYDDVETIATKVRFARQNGLLGYFAWHAGVDNNWNLSRQASQAWEDNLSSLSEVYMMIIVSSNQTKSFI